MKIRLFSLILVSIAISSCGFWGGGKTTPTPTPTNGITGVSLIGDFTNGTGYLGTIYHYQKNQKITKITNPHKFAIRLYHADETGNRVFDILPETSTIEFNDMQVNGQYQSTYYGYLDPQPREYAIIIDWQLK